MNALNSETLLLAKALIERPSVTPEDAGCQALIAERLRPLGFTFHELKFGSVQNLVAIRKTSKEPASLLAFAGHTDVVPAGPLNHWHTPPFSPSIKEGFLYGRGAADMKGSLAAMITACERFIVQNPNHKGSIAFLITSDEEGDAEWGTRKIMEFLAEQHIQINYCIVGEPSSLQRLGDNIKIGRRGSMTGRLKILGQQGHVAYPHLADNSIHRALAPLHQLLRMHWGAADDNFPATSFQISNIHAGTGAGNVIPGLLECLFNFRFNPQIHALTLQAQVQKVLEEHALNYELNWQIFGEPFLTRPGVLLNACQQAILQVVGIQANLSTDGGTSDARFIAGPNTEVIELGPLNATIHAANECVNIEELEQLSIIYERVLESLM